jgi:hypothetical protein
MKPRPLVLGASLLLLLATLPQAADATQILYRSPRQLGVESSLVARGRVVSVRSFWNQARTKILTETRIALDETYKGPSSPEARVLQLGGVVDNVRVNVAGALRWQQGEEVLVFLEPCGPGAYQVTGFSQGKLPIVRDDEGRAYVVRPETKGARIVGVPSSGAAAPNAAGPARTRLTDFLDQALGRKGGER